MKIRKKLQDLNEEKCDCQEKLKKMNETDDENTQA